MYTFPMRWILKFGKAVCIFSINNQKFKNNITLASSSESNVNVHGVAEARGAGAKATVSVKNQINRTNNVDLAGKLNRGKHQCICRIW